MASASLECKIHVPPSSHGDLYISHLEDIWTQWRNFLVHIESTICLAKKTFQNIILSIKIKHSKCDHVLIMKSCDNVE